MMDKAIPPLVLAIVGAAVAWAFSPSMAARPAMLAILAGAYAPLVALSLYRMWRDGTLLDLFRFRSGDLTLGVGIAAFLGACCWLGRTLVAPRGSPADMLVMRVYVQLGEVPADRSTYALVALALVFVAIADEIVWRGLVQQVLEERWGVRAGWLGTAGLYALAHAPTIWLLGVPGSPRNPLVVTAALFCGVVWGFAVGRMQRLPPAILSHAALTFLLAMQFRLWAPGLLPEPRAPSPEPRAPSAHPARSPSTSTRAPAPPNRTRLRGPRVDPQPRRGVRSFPLFAGLRASVRTR